MTTEIRFGGMSFADLNARRKWEVLSSLVIAQTPQSFKKGDSRRLYCVAEGTDGNVHLYECSELQADVRMLIGALEVDRYERLTWYVGNLDLARFRAG